MFAKTLLSAAALALSIGAAQAQSYPRLAGGADNTTVEYASGFQGNIVGGGRVIASFDGENHSIAHLDGATAQQPPRGRTPSLITWGDRPQVVWTETRQAAPRLLANR